MPGDVLSESWVLQSERLRWRTWREEDVPRALSLWGDSQVMRYLTRSPLDEAAVRARLAREATTQRERGAQYWPLFLRESGAFVGCCGLKPRPPDAELLELGFHLRPEAWGRGLAKEAARTVVAHAWRIGTPRLFAGHHPENHGSRRVLEGLGFRLTHEEFYEPTGLMHACLALARPPAD